MRISTLVHVIFFLLLSLPKVVDLKETTQEKKLMGTWINEDDTTRSIIKCEVRYDEGKFFVKVWGSCMPVACYWGETFSMEKKENSQEIKIYWNQGFAEQYQYISLKNDKLIISTEIKYLDNSGRKDGTIIDYFIRE